MISGVNWFFRSIWVFVIGVIIPFGALAVVFLPIYDHLFPNEQAIVHLEEKQAKGIRILLAKNDHEVRFNGVTVEKSSIRKYAMMPSFLWTFDVYEYSKRFNNEGQVEVLGNQGLFFIILDFLIFILLIRYSIPMLVKHMKMRSNGWA